MFARHGVLVALLFSLVSFGLIGCGNSSLDSIAVSPAAQSLAAGQTAQLQAIGTYGSASRHTTQNLTSGVSWSTSSSSVATVSSSGMVTAVAVGTATITATAMAYNGQATSSAIVTVSNPSTGSGSSGGNILSLTIIPSSIVFGSLTQSGQFLAIGTFSNAPTVRDLTNSVTWLTSAPNVFPVTNFSNSVTGTGTQNGGVVSAYGSSVGNVGATITAEAMDSSGSIATATATVGCPLVYRSGQPAKSIESERRPGDARHVQSKHPTTPIDADGVQRRAESQYSRSRRQLAGNCSFSHWHSGRYQLRSRRRYWQIGLHGDLSPGQHCNPDCACTKRSQIRRMVLQLHEHRNDHTNRTQHLLGLLVVERRHRGSYLQLKRFRFWNLTEARANIFLLPLFLLSRFYSTTCLGNNILD